MAIPPTPAIVVRTATYDSYKSGSSRDVQPDTKPGLFLMGGAKDSDEGFKWFLDHAGGGDVVILRASGADGYNEYLQKLGPVNSVESIVLKQREAASDPAILDKIRHAEGVFFAGGDQSKYFDLIQGTPLADELNQALQRGIPIGGTSAGLAIMGGQAFSARGHKVESPEALANPASPDITLEPSFIHNENLQGCLTDTHFSQRDRLGRLMVFMDNLKNVRGVGIDEATAVLLEGDGTGKVVGEHNAVFVTGPDAKGQFLVQDVPAGCDVDVKTWGSKAIPRTTFVIRDHQVTTP